MRGRKSDATFVMTRQNWWGSKGVSRYTLAMLAVHPVTPPYLQLYLLTYLVGGHEAADREPLAPKGLGDLIAKVSIEVDHVVDERQAR